MNGLKNLRVLDIYEAERIKEDLMEEPVVIEATSDIILSLGPHRSNFDNLPFYDDIKDGEFINLMTGQIDDIKKDVVTDNHFLEIYLCGQLRLGDIEGIYAARSKKHDALIFCICELKRCSDGTYCWKEKKGGRTFVSASFSMDAQTIRACNHEYGYVDICGQAQAPNRNFTLGLKKKVFEYFGPLTFATKIAERAIFPMATIEQIINTINILINKDEKIYEEGIPVTKYDGAGVFTGLVKQDDSPDPGLVSADAKAAMERFMKKVVLPNFAKSFFDYGANYGKSYDVSIVLISYLQNVNGNLVERAFLPVVYPEYDFTKSEVAFYEVQQTLIQNGEYNLNSCYISSVTVYCEGDIEKTSIGGMAKWTLRPFIETINNVDALDDKGFSICHTYARFSENIEFRTIDMVQQMCEQSTDLIDKILKIKDMDFKAANLLIRQAQFAGCPTDECLFGPVDRTQHKLHKMLCIPKGLLEYIIACKYPYNTIFYCKKIFPGSKEAANYFENMCKEDFEMLADYMSDNKHDKKRIIIQLLSKMYGYKNWKGYISHINKFTQENLEDYIAYMQTVEEISSLVNASFDWKLSGRALNKAYVSAIRQRNDLMNKEAKKEEELFRAKCKNWRSLEYKNDKFLVIAPKEPSDLITEGLRLKHCAKEYITPVAYGKTTIMFVRKKEEPDKPFFTVEIRDNAIRQCHGICNKNACAEAGVRDFLTEYSEAKNLPIGDIDKRLGPEDEEIVPDEEIQHNEELLDAGFYDEGLFD